MKEFALKLWKATTKVFAAIQWRRTEAVLNGGMYYRLTESDHDTIRRLLKDSYLLIFTRRSCHLTTYLIGLISFLKSFKSVHYVHVLMNVEGDLDGHLGFKLIEATNSGVHYSTFMEVFDCDSVALLKPRGVDLAEWTKAMDYVKSDLGKEYDNIFDITNDKEVSCVELVYWALKTLPDYEQRFPNLVALLQRPHANLTPQELYDTGDFDVVFEVRR